MTGMFDREGLELTADAVRTKLAILDTTRVNIELLDEADARVTTVGLDFPPDIAAAITRCRLMEAGEE